MNGAAKEWTGGDGFTPDLGDATGSGFTVDTTYSAGEGFAQSEDFDGNFDPANISKHATGEGPSDGGCRICGDIGHFARDCPDKKPNDGLCFNCQEPGHSKADCPNPRVEREFDGQCRLCGETGHRAADCPQKPAETCNICHEEGHVTNECAVNRLLLGIESLDVKEAWDALESADRAKDLDEIKRAVLVYAASDPQLTFPELEITFREANGKTYLIAKEQELSLTHTIVNLQGQPGQKYVLTYQFSPKPRRLRQDQGWPESPEQNMSRLAEAGFVMDSFVPKCSNCGEMGHIRSKCPEERREPERVKIVCSLCEQEGHRARDCTQPRKKMGGGECRICGETGHMARECPSKEERVMECRNCSQEGHMAKDCPEPKDLTKMQCRNCDQTGHVSRECPLPTDWSRVECSNCHEKGHSYKRCTQPAAEANNGDGGW